ncbi:uncharacterized protein [Epargyreus clarus]|uniref:uncharacterized protein n=1 Tax=Epargyreus clarus TaxID=520877 RepID=UPI003C2BE790
MEEIMNALQLIRQEINEQKLENQKNADRVTERVTQNMNKILDEKFSSWEGKCQILENKVEQQERRIQFLEKQSRKRNIVFFGIAENETSYKNLENNLLQFIKENLHIDLVYSDLQEVKRVGKKGEKPRPIIATFSTLGHKINILKQKRLLKDTHYYMNEDYPRDILEKRKELQEQVKQEREKGNKVTIKYDKLVILPKSNNKRTLPTSPESNPQPQMASSMHTNKKNKILLPNSSIRRSNSVSEGVLKPGILNFLVDKKAINTQPDQDNDYNNKQA